MTRRLAFMPLALSFFLAALAGPFMYDAGRLISDLNAEQQELQWELSREVGNHVYISSPTLKVPVIRSATSTTPGASEISLYPASLDIRIQQDTQTTMLDGRAVNWSNNDIIMTARFERSENSGVLAEDESLNWEAAYLHLPMASTKSLRSGPRLVIGGRLTAFDRKVGAHERVRFETAIIGVPDADVTLSMNITSASSPTTIGPTGWHTEITLITDNLALSFGDVRPDSAMFHWLGRTLRWSIDGTLSYGKVKRDGFVKDGNSGFLGISFSEPDGLGPITVYSDRVHTTYSRYNTLVRLVPLAFALAALFLWATRAPGYLPQMGLLVIFICSLSASAFLAPRIGNQAAWNVGAAFAAIGALAMFQGLGWKTAVFMMVVTSGLWVALWDAPFTPRLSNGLSVGAIAPDLAQPILLGICLCALLVTGVQATLRRWKSTGAKERPK